MATRDRGRHGHRLHRRRPGRPLLRAADEAAGPGAPRPRRRAQQALRHLRLGRRLLRPDARQPAGGRPAVRGADPRRLQPLGRHRGQHPRREVRLGRPRLLRHRQEAPAQHPAGALRGSRRRAGVRDRRASRPPTTPMPTWSSPATASTAASAREYADTYKPDVDMRRTASSGSARRGCSRPSPSTSRRRRTAGSRRTPTASTRPTRPSSSRRPRRSGRRPASTRWRRKRRSRSARSSSPRRCTAIRCSRTRRTCAARRSGSGSRASSASAGCTGSIGAAATPRRRHAGRPDGRRRAHGALLDRLGHQARARGRDRAGALASASTRGDLPARAAALRGAAQRRGAEDPERGAQLDRVVRARRPLRQPAARAVRLLAADAQPAHQPREPAPARQGVRRGLRGLDRVAAPASARDAACGTRSRRC